MVATTVTHIVFFQIICTGDSAGEFILHDTRDFSAQSSNLEPIEQDTSLNMEKLVISSPKLEVAVQF